MIWQLGRRRRKILKKVSKNQEEEIPASHPIQVRGVQILLVV